LSDICGFAYVVIGSALPKSHIILLPRCYQDRRNRPHRGPYQSHSDLLFLVGFGCLRLTCQEFVNRESELGFSYFRAIRRGVENVGKIEPPQPTISNTSTLWGFHFLAWWVGLSVSFSVFLRRAS